MTGPCSPTRDDPAAARDHIARRHTARLWRLAADAVTDLANAAPVGRLRDHLKDVADGLHDTARAIEEGAERL